MVTKTQALNIVAKLLALVLHIWEDLNLDSETGYPD
jgi:hypothetical protein